MNAASTSGPQTESSPGLSRFAAEDGKLDADRGSETFLYFLK